MHSHRHRLRAVVQRVAARGRAIVLLGACLATARAYAVDPPHATSNQCAACHIAHNALDGDLASFAGNANLCSSCHQAGGLASAQALVSGDQALPWPGLPAGTNAFGTSHRWDSGPFGHLAFLGGAATPSTGRLQPSGGFTGVYAKTYTLIITNAGAVGVARFNWVATTPGGGTGSNVLTGTNVALDEGILMSFVNGTGTSFQVNDKWHLYVRPDLRQTTNATMLLHMTNGVAYCSTCHDQHSQAHTPFDPVAPAYSGTNTGAGRHFLRVDNDADQMCLDCHSPRNVTNSVFGSHPVGIVITTNAYYQNPVTLPREKGTSKVGCLTCHAPHFGPDNDGMVLRLTNTVALCVDCHRLADTNSPAAHLVSTNSNMLWPGGQYGSLMPARTDTTLRGSCVNCHAVHGWPDAASPTNHYPTLLADREENLCFTCHDANGPAVKRVKADFDLAWHHPVGNADPYRRAGRSVECNDCHHVHDALANGHVYTNVATAARNQVSNPLKGVAGVAVNYTSLTNFQVIATNLYTVLPESAGGATYEYQICFKCHTGYRYPSTSAGTATFTTNSATVSGTGTAWTNSMIGMWIARTNDTRTYVITNVASATSLAIMPVYGSATAATQGYTIWDLPAGITPVYTNGTATFTTNSTTVTGVSTVWTNAMAGLWICRTSDPVNVYKILRVVNTTNLVIAPAYVGVTAATQRYAVSGGTDLAQEFSFRNRSGHPVVTGLDNYTNSLTVGSPARRGLQPSALKNPWTNNVGQQTMMCSDCHDSTTTNYVASAAQGPHGSAAQFMLRGPNATNWPNVLLSSFATSWCANCHNNFGGIHARSEHTGQRCYACHIIIPHGGRVSRLMGDRETMPARYAWNNTLTNMQIQSFNKMATNSYVQGSCQAACTSTHGTAASENW